MKKICIFLGSRHGNNQIYIKSIKALANNIVKNQFEIVYGGADIGLMSELADTALSLHGKIHGVIPEILTKAEIAHTGLTKLHITKTINERKELMISISDAFIVFPGGLGTLEELFDTWSAIKLQKLDKPLVLLNINSYFNHLIDFLNHSTKQGFIDKNTLKKIIICDTEMNCIQTISKHFELETLK